MRKIRKEFIQQIYAIVASWEDPAMLVFLFFFSYSSRRNERETVSFFLLCHIRADMGV